MRPTQSDPAYDSDAFNGRRLKPRGKRRKPFGIQCRWTVPSTLTRYPSLARFSEWHVFSRYETESRRDQAYDTLAKKERNSSSRFKIHYRKIDSV